MRQTIRKAMRVLDLFSLARPEWGVGEVARCLELPKSTTSELMASLADERLLARTQKGRYRLGWQLFELSQTLLDTTELRTEARGLMEELVRTWGETVHLAVLDGVQAVYVEKLQPTPAIKICISRTGARLPAHCSGVGKVLLASSEWDHVAAQFEDQGMPALTSNTITTLDLLSKELCKVREQGYALDEEESMVGLCCAAAPIRDPAGTTVAAVSISVPAYRFNTKEKDYTDAVLDTAWRISESARPKPREFSNQEM